jgi:hypothetical protein
VCLIHTRKEQINIVHCCFHIGNKWQRLLELYRKISYYTARRRQERCSAITPCCLVDKYQLFWESFPVHFDSFLPRNKATYPRRGKSSCLLCLFLQSGRTSTTTKTIISFGIAIPLCSVNRFNVLCARKTHKWTNVANSTYFYDTFRSVWLAIIM